MIFYHPMWFTQQSFLALIVKWKKNLEDKAFGGQVIDGPVESLWHSKSWSSYCKTQCIWFPTWSVEIHL